MPPYLSVVIAARNDNYGGDFLHRIQMFVKNNLTLWNKYGLDAELVIVEWNPPEDRQRLKDAIVWPKPLEPATVRIIEVPKQIHQKIPNSDRMQMREYPAKNVGISRAKGRYVLATNPDLLFSEELIAHLASKSLLDDCFYRIDRYDFHGPVPLEMRPEKAIKFAKRRIYQVNVRQDADSLLIPITPNRGWFHAISGRWPGSFMHKGDGRQAVVLDYNNGPYGGIYTNASGDFILTSLDNWHKIRGFPEFTDTFTHLDSYACHQLRALGLKQMLFIPPCMVLHMEHPRTEQQYRPKVANQKWMEDLEMIRAGKTSFVINGESWGLTNENLQETIVQEE